MNYETLVQVMRRLALEAGDKIMEIYDSPDFEVKTKSDEIPVTEADEAADFEIAELFEDIGAAASDDDDLAPVAEAVEGDDSAN